MSANRVVRVTVWTLPATEHEHARQGWHFRCYTCQHYTQPVWKWWDPTLDDSEARGDRHYAWHRTFDPDYLPGRPPAPETGGRGGGSPPATPLAEPGGTP